LWNCLARGNGEPAAADRFPIARRVGTRIASRLSLRKLGFDFCEKRLIEAHEYRALQLARRVACPQVSP
jgi:hypothetical protein